VPGGPETQLFFHGVVQISDAEGRHCLISSSLAG
jgi:hypothetical protein